MFLISFLIFFFRLKLCCFLRLISFDFISSSHFIFMFICIISFSIYFFQLQLLFLLLILFLWLFTPCLFFLHSPNCISSLLLLPFLNFCMFIYTTFLFTFFSIFNFFSKNILQKGMNDCSGLTVSFIKTFSTWNMSRFFKNNLRPFAT